MADELLTPEAREEFMLLPVDVRVELFSKFSTAVKNFNEVRRLEMNLSTSNVAVKELTEEEKKKDLIDFNKLIGWSVPATESEPTGEANWNSSEPTKVEEVN